MTRKQLLDRASTALPSLTYYYNDQGEYVEGEGDILASFIAKTLNTSQSGASGAAAGGRGAVKLAPLCPRSGRGHNAAIFAGRLGHTRDELERWREAGVI